MATYLLYVRYERPTFGRVQQYRRSSSWFFLLLPAFTTSSSSFSATSPVVDQRKHFSRTIRARPVKKGFPACRFFLLLVVVVGYLRAKFLHNTHFNIFNIYTHTHTDPQMGHKRRHRHTGWWNFYFSLLAFLTSLLFLPFSLFRNERLFCLFQIFW